MPSLNRPTSPHLTIYKPQISSVLSITHRLTGVALFVGSALVVAWLWAAAYAPAYYAEFHGYLASQWGQGLLIAWTAAFYFHLANGIRHLFWDIGKGFSILQMNFSGWLVLLFTVAATAGSWGYIYQVMGQ